MQKRYQMSFPESVLAADNETIIIYCKYLSIT